MNSSVIAILLVLAYAQVAVFDTVWDTLRVTFSVPFLDPYAFAKMPLTEKDAKDQGFTLLDSNSSCEGTFLGKRYRQSKDNSVIMLYDKNGYIAGIQSSFAENRIQPGIKSYFQKDALYVEEKVDGQTSYTLTAYFVNPGIICDEGRSEESFKAQKTGSGLFVQNGSDPRSDYITIPLTQSGIDLETDWKQGHCVPAMGLHYWYNVTTNMDCNYFRPMFALYNNRKLTAFGWASIGPFPSRRYEHPPDFVLGGFIKPVPLCLYKWYDTFKAFSTMHIYMNFDPLNLLC